MMKLTGDKALDRYFATANASAERGAVRPGLDAAGQEFVKEIRNNIKAMVSPAAASRAGGVRFNRQGAKTSLAKSITKRRWTVPNKGILGVAVGPKWPDGAHGHLVEYGHIVVSHGKSTGVKSKPIPFQRRADNQATRARSMQSQRERMKRWINRQANKGR